MTHLFIFNLYFTLNLLNAVKLLTKTISFQYFTNKNQLVSTIAEKLKKNNT